MAIYQALNIDAAQEERCPHPRLFRRFASTRSHSSSLPAASHNNRIELLNGGANGRQTRLPEDVCVHHVRYTANMQSVRVQKS